MNPGVHDLPVSITALVNVYDDLIVGPGHGVGDVVEPGVSSSRCR